jgi:peroxiredoxin
MTATPFQQQIDTVVRNIAAVATTPLQQQIDAYNAQARSRLPAGLGDELPRQLTSPIAQLIASGAAERALREGEQAPDFTLPDALGRSVTLSRLLQRGPVVLTFYRGAWCPYCNLELHAYQHALPQIEELGGTLVAISPQTPDHSLSMMEKRALTFTVLSDEGNGVARRYGLAFTIDEAVRAAHRLVGADLPAFNGDESWELPMAATYLVDQAGTVRLAFVDPDFMHRLDPSVVIARLKELPGLERPGEGRSAKE